jgi:hypothetical protein
MRDSFYFIVHKRYPPHKWQWCQMTTALVAPWWHWMLHNCTTISTISNTNSRSFCFKNHEFKDYSFSSSLTSDHCQRNCARTGNDISQIARAIITYLLPPWGEILYHEPYFWKIRFAQTRTLFFFPGTACSIFDNTWDEVNVDTYTAKGTFSLGLMVVFPASWSAWG